MNPGPALDPGPSRSGFRGAVAFLTPFGGPSGPGPGAVAWFPVVGAAMGLLLGGVWWVAVKAWPAPVAAALVVMADLGLTGMLHFDGLVDSADGLLAHLPRERRLTVMSSPEVGAFGMAVGVAVLLARGAALATIRPAPLLVAGLWCASRTLMAAVMRVVPYAKDRGGLATAFLGRSGGVAVVLGGVAAVVLAGGWRRVAGPAAILAAAAGGAGVVLLARRKLGGFTGDVLGAAGVVAETVGLIVASAKW
ncbi:MAG: adenosylcobinamide-GDP ribazoletransferase [Acidimicrobiaceae bacterium]|nr:adenosylcobinamide-GDP ribazoletransferase [Acidimicrobiaceae bacterium]MDQ1421834.1 adenosylcobinamide-GDP ribazoletransferase [Acidimicrobiaceae bacterium]